MQKIYVALLLLLSTTSAMAQEEEPEQVIPIHQERWRTLYRASATKDQDLVHTKLVVRPDYVKTYLYGEAWVTLKPHFYATDTLRLDAKGMTIEKVALVTKSGIKNLKYSYTDGLNLHIQLDKTYKGGEKYTIYIKYISKPNEFKAQGSAAITDAKGLYFINPDGKVKDKPVQLWTQGETEGSSVWFPTIDRPDQKTTEEIILTVPSKYVTLSNGYLATSKKNADGTRTDHWKMDQPHAPYLFFFGVGDYAVIKDKYKGKEVNYYVEPAYAAVARKIYGNTPQMMAFYSKILGIEYPWVKYSQMTARDYVSGAMENTTATLHTDALQQNARQLTDGNKYEDYVAHELFHQWFGDYVTCESWSNLTVNESFANYSETLWNAYKYGKDAGDHANYTDMQGYLRSGQSDVDLVRFYYKDKEDMFDAVSYNKGGRILHMLRHYVGDSAFFKSLNLYLNEHKYSTGEAHQLRLAFEQITGQDMNWFWNQWYFNHGHPVVDISYVYDAASRKIKVLLQQKQTNTIIFKMPVDIDIYQNGSKVRHTVWMQSQSDTFAFDARERPDLVNVDGDKIMLWDKTDHKTMAEFDYQYDHAAGYVDRREAIAYALNHQEDAGSMDIIKKGLTDKYYILREFTLNSIKKPSADIVTTAVSIAQSDPYRTTKASAITLLGNLADKKYQPLFESYIRDSSYTLSGAALIALSKVDESAAMKYVPELSKDAKGVLELAVKNLSVNLKTDADFDQEYDEFSNASMMGKWQQLPLFIKYLGRVNNVDNFKKGLKEVTDFRNKIGNGRPQVLTMVNNMLNGLLKTKQSAMPKSSNIDAEIETLKGVLK